jgi:L-rhamnose isomerase/sugar isomerase
VTNERGGRDRGRLKFRDSAAAAAVDEELPMTAFSAIAASLEDQAIELPSWAFGNSGTRFKVFAQPGVPRNPFEKISDAAQVHKHTGLAPKVALHIPWDRVEDYAALAEHAAAAGVSIGTINSNTFQDDAYKLGSLAHADANVRQKAIDHHFECIDIMHATKSKDLKIWLADGSNYPGQADMRRRQDWLAESLRKIYERLDKDQRMVLEYKFFEPAFYHTDIPDWGTAYVQVRELGDQATVCLDTGHHAPGTNIEFIVAQLLRLGKLGAFDFNSRFYADDDLIVGAADPFQLFRIMFEVVRGGGYGARSGVTFMLDQCHNIEEKIPGQIRSVLNVQEMTARALLVDRSRLAKAQEAGDVLAAHDIFMQAFYTDVRAPLASWRSDRGLPADPLEAFRASGYLKKIAAERVGGAQAGWGA